MALEGADQSANRQALLQEENPEPQFLDLPKWKIELGRWEDVERVRALFQKAEKDKCVRQIITYSNLDVEPAALVVCDAYRALRKLNKEQEFGMSLAMREAISNGVRPRDRHGKPAAKRKFQHHASVRYALIQNGSENGHPDPRFFVHIEDEGKGFDPRFTPNLLHPENLESQNGRGVYIVGCYLNVKEDSKLGGRTVYLPLDPDTAGDPFLTRDLWIDLPLDESPDIPLQERFRKIPEVYVPQKIHPVDVHNADTVVDVEEGDTLH